MILVARRFDSIRIYSLLQKKPFIIALIKAIAGFY